MSIIRAREIFIRRQIKRARETAEHYRALNDFTSAATFEDWACDAEIELILKRKAEETVKGKGGST